MPNFYLPRARTIRFTRSDSCLYLPRILTIRFSLSNLSPYLPRTLKIWFSWTNTCSYQPVNSGRPLGPKKVKACLIPTYPELGPSDLHDLPLRVSVGSLPLPAPWHTHRKKGQSMSCCVERC